MFRYINIYYFLAIGVAITLWKLNAELGSTIELFYGFAENKETEINFNHPVEIKTLHISPGQFVAVGAQLADIVLIKEKDQLLDQNFRISELNAESEVWRTEKRGDIALIQSKKNVELASIDAQIKKIEEERAFQETLFKDLETISEKETNYAPLTQKIIALQEERVLKEKSFNTEVQNIEKELAVGQNPFSEQIKRMNAQLQFEKNNIRKEFTLTAPFDGLIGNINVKEGEHVQSYRNLISYYEPNPTIVKGFVHEDLIVGVALNDSFLITSVKDETLEVQGKVYGLGSRIVEIPNRMSRIKEIKTYGREVLLEIPKENGFLQKEKVVIRFLDENGQPKQAPTIRSFINSITKK